jgi:hypothetical protein
LCCRSQQGSRHLDRSSEQFHRSLRSGETPVFRLFSRPGFSNTETLNPESACLVLVMQQNKKAAEETPQRPLFQLEA